MDIILEIFGYIGTAVVVLSMTMSSITKLRIVNICGSVICAIYAIITVTWPIAIMNFALISINLYRLLRDHSKSKASQKKENNICENKGGKCE